MWFNRKTYRVIRADTPVGFNKKVWTEVGTIVGTYTLMSAADSIRNNQLFADAKALITCDLSYKDSVLDSDRLIDPDDKVFRVVAAPLSYDNVLKHIEVAVAEEQNFTEIEEVT